MSAHVDEIDLTSPVDRLYAEVADMCRSYCTAHDCGPSTLGRLALNDTIFIQKVLRGDSVTTKKLRQLETFLQNPLSPADIRAASKVSA